MATRGANVSGTACLVNVFSGLLYIMLLNSMFVLRPGTIYYYMVITEVQTPWLSTQQSHHSLCTQTRALLLPACCPDVLQTISRERELTLLPSIGSRCYSTALPCIDAENFIPLFYCSPPLLPPAAVGRSLETGASHCCSSTTKHCYYCGRLLGCTPSEELGVW